MFTETEQGAIMPSMGRTPTTDRQNITADDSPVIAMRLTPREAGALDELVRMQQAQADELGIAGAVTRASAMRQLLRGAAKAKGIWDGSPAHPAPVVAPIATLETELDAVLEAANATKPAAELDAAKIRTRVERALKASRFDSAADLARVAAVGPNDVSRIRKGFGLVSDKLSKLDAALAAKGL